MSDGTEEVGGQERVAGSDRGASRMAKRIGWVAAGVLGVLALGYGIAALIVTFLLDPATVSDWVEPRVEAALNRPVELEGVRIRIFPTLAAELQNLEIGNLPAFEGPPLARVGGVRLAVSILPLFRGRVRVDEIRIDEPGLHLAVDSGGVSNFGDLVPEAQDVEDEEGSPLELAIREIVVRSGTVTYESAPDTLRFALSGLEADASVERSESTGWLGQVEARSERISLGHPALGRDSLLLDGPGLRGRVSAGEEFEWIEIGDGGLILGDAELALSGRAEDLKEPVRNVNLALESEDLSIPGMFELLPDSVAGRLPGRGTGTLAVDLRIRGTLGPEERPLVRGQVRLQDVGFVGRSDRVLAEGIGGVLNVREDELAIQGVQGSVLGGPFSVDGSVSPDSVLAFDLALSAGPRLEVATELVTLAEGTQVAGDVEADLRLVGMGREPYRTALTGTMDARGIRFEAARMGVPLTVESASLTFQGDRVSWQDVGLGLGEDRIVVSGAIQSPLGVLSPAGELLPRVDARLTGSRLDLDRILPPRSDTAVTYGQLAFARMGGRSIRGRTPEEWATEKGLAHPDSLPMTGRVSIALDTVISAPFRLSDVDATVDFTPSLVSLSDTRFTLYGGVVRTGVQVGAGSRDVQPFSLTLQTEGIRGADFLAAVSPLGRHLSGLLDLELNVAGEMDRQMLPISSTVSGSASSILRDGRLEETPLTRTLSRALSLASLASPTISRWTARMELEGSSVRFVESAMATDVGPLAYGGTIGLDGSLDLGLRLSLASARVDSVALRQRGLLGAVAGRLTGAGPGGESPIGIGIGIGGTLSNPSLSARSSLASTVGGALDGVVTESVDQLRDTARARVDAVRDTAVERAEAVRDSAVERIRAEREAAETEARQQAEDARRELEDRARGFLRGLVGPGREEGDTAGAAPDTSGAAPDTATSTEDASSGATGSTDAAADTSGVDR